MRIATDQLIDTKLGANELRPNVACIQTSMSKIEYWLYLENDKAILSFGCLL